MTQQPALDIQHRASPCAAIATEIVTRDGSGQYTLHDAGSLNGTYLDGDRIEHALLREGAQVQVGRFRLVFVIGTLGGAA